MKMYYILLEGKPLSNNRESEVLAGAYINCWVKSKDEITAKDKVIKYVHNQGWKVLNIKEIFITNRDRYVDEPESLECFNSAIEYGIDAFFYTWPK